jgi:outer membrane protein assembly factor BamE (lipoprotein component of BamABCDE complex)
MLKTTTICLILALTCSACASIGTDYNEAAVARLQPGMTKADVIAVLGRPNGQTTMADGQQL